MIRPVTAPAGPQAQGDRLPIRDWSPDRILRRLESQPPDAFASTAIADPSLLDSNLAHVTNCVAQALPETRSRAADIKADLERAGFYEPLAYQKLAALRFAGMFLSLVVFGTLTIIASERMEPWCLVGVVVGMSASWWLPVWQLRRRANRRMDEIEQALPDLVGLIHVYLSQGVNVPSALATASRELRVMHPALSDELAIVCRQAELDRLEVALENFELRIDLPDVRSLVSRLLEADEASPKVATLESR
jgi:tight adherence protein C